MSKRKKARRGKRSQQQRSPWLIPLLAVVGLLIIGGAALAIWLPDRTPDLASDFPPDLTLTVSPPSVAATAGPLGAVDGCRSGPRFQSSLGLGERLALATTLTSVTGLAILEPGVDNGPGRVYQHETWDDAGFIGPFITDRSGHIYVAPVPLVSLEENPPELQNRIYRVDSDSQEMALFVELPWAQPPSGANPFGVVGLAYDCETESLYATSLSGSTAGQEVGRIFRIDLKTGQVTSQLDGVDAMGVSAFNGADGKRLYFGLARTPEVRSIALDARGDFVGESRPEFSYADYTSGGRRTTRRIRFDGSDLMALNLTDFNYSLQVASERIEDRLSYRYDPIDDSWAFERSEVVN